MRIRSVCAIVFVILLSGQRVRAEGQQLKDRLPQTIPTVSEETYRKVLDIVFPIPSQISDFRTDYILTVRITPSFSAGLQLGFVVRFDGTNEAEILTLTNPDSSIRDQLDSLVSVIGTQNPNVLAERLSVKRQLLQNSQKTTMLLKRFSTLKVAPLLNTEATLDATRFDLWFLSAANEAHFSVVGSEPGFDRKDNPLVRWMNEVRSALVSKDYIFPLSEK